jgi:hypothetical protein
MRVAHMAGRAPTQGQNNLARGLQSKGLIKRSHAINFHNGYAQSQGGGFHGIYGKVTIFFLDVLEDLNKLMRLAAAWLQNPVKLLDWHVNLLQEKVLLLIIKITDMMLDVNTE